MQPLSVFFSFSLVSALTVTAQSPLTTFYNGTNQANPGAQFFFDLAVTNTLTIQAFDINLSSAPGVQGTIEVYTTLPGVGTYFGNTANATQWSAAPVATGTIVAAGGDQPSYCCLTPGITLTPGTTGFALRHVGVQPVNSIGNGSPLPGGGSPTTNQTYGNADLTVLSGHVQNVPWVRGAAPRAWNGGVHYALGTAPHACAKNTPWGPGCYREQASFYQFFSQSPDAAAALTGRTLSLINTNPGYLLLQNQPGVAFVPPTIAATALVPVDDGETTWAWPSGTPFGPGGPTAFFVHSNGIVSVASNTALAPNVYRANVPGFLAALSTAWYSWHDYNPTAGGSGPIRCEELGGVVYVTWDGVESYPAATINPSKFQFQFVLATGDVHYAWAAVTAIGGSAFGDSHVVGFSPGGPNLDLGPTDLTTLSSLLLSTVDVPGLTLSITARTAVGTSIDYVLDNYTNSSFPIGILFLSLADLPPFSPAGVDLGFLGAGGCVLNIDLNVVPLQGVFVAPSSLTYTLNIPLDYSWLGDDWYSQAVWFDPTVNTFGALTSNAWKQTVGTF